MRVTRFGTRLVLAFVTAVTMLAGLPATQAAPSSSAICDVQGMAYDSSFQEFDMLCGTGSGDLAGPWHFTDNNGSLKGTGPRGEIATGVVLKKICVIVRGGWYTVCETAKITVCINGFCRTYTVVICVTYWVPGVLVCVEVKLTGPFTGNAVWNGDAVEAERALRAHART